MLWNTELDSWLLSLWRLCQFETFLPDAPHQRGLLRMLMIYFSGKLWKGGQSPICLRIFQGKVLSAVSRINGLTCKGPHHTQSLIDGNRLNWERGIWKVSFQLWLEGREPLYERLQGCFFFSPCLSFIPCCFMHINSQADKVKEPPQTLFTCHCYTSVSKASFEGSNQIK